VEISQVEFNTNAIQGTEKKCGKLPGVEILDVWKSIGFTVSDKKITIFKKTNQHHSLL